MTVHRLLGLNDAGRGPKHYRGRENMLGMLAKVALRICSYT